VANTRRVAGVVRSYDVVEQPGTQGQPGTKKLGEPARCIPGCSLLRSWPAACALCSVFQGQSSHWSCTGLSARPVSALSAEPGTALPSFCWSARRARLCDCVTVNRQTTVTGWSINKEAVAHDILRTAECRRLVAWTIWP